MPILEANNIIHGYKNEEVLHGISLRIRKGEFVALTGESGSGKSTLLSILSSLLRPTSGSVVVDGEELRNIGNIDTFRREKIGFVFQFHYLIDYLNLFENITLATSKENYSHAFELMERLGIVGLKDRRPSEISGGQRQRAAIARALVNNPVILFADEPTGNLDSKNSQAVYELLYELTKERGTSVVIATHDQKLAAKADTHYRMEDGYIATNA